MQQVCGLVVDDAAHIGLGIGEGLVDDQALGHLLHLGDDPVVDGIEYDQPPRRRAALARRGEGRLDDERRRILDLGRIEHDDRIVAAHLQRDDLARLGRELAIDRDARTRGPCEQHAIDQPVPDQCLALFGTADQQLDHVFGDLGGVEAFDEEFRRGGGFLAGFEDHRVPGDQGRNDMAVGKVGGEIIRTEHGHDAMRLVADGSRARQGAVEFLLPGPLRIGGNRDFHLADHRFHFGARLPQGLAGFARDDFGEGFSLATHFIGEAAHQLDPVGDGKARPGRKGGAGPLDRRVGIADGTTP